MTEEEKLKLEDSLKAEKEFFVESNELMELIGKLKNDTDKIESVCLYLKTLNNQLGAGIERHYAEKELLSNQTEAIQSIIKIVKELDERISKLENQ